MVFSSIPAYLDPTNWQQQQTNHQSGTSNTNHQLQTPAQPAPPPPGLVPPHAGGGSGSIRPGSMAERARLANIPMPEGPLKCPRCESTNTKFCYFNNYSLTQPRHFCKTCRRYWTRGGALRSVPVGGGCRRNKRSKSTSSKSSTTSSNCDHPERTSSSTNTVSSNTGLPTNILGLTSQLPPLRFLSPLGQLADHYNSSGELSLNYNSGISAPLVGTSEMNFHVGANLLGGGDGSVGGGGGGSGGLASLLSSGGGGIEQWRMQQAQPFHFLSGLDQSPGGLFHQFQSGVDQSGGGFVGEASQVRPKLSTSFLSQMASVKVEDHNNQELNLSRQLLGISGNDHHQWSNSTTTPWTDLTTFNSSSTSNPL